MSKLQTRPLNMKEKIFIAEYERLGGGKGCGTPAAIVAGYKPSFASIAACRMLQREPVQREIEKRQKARLRALHPKALDAVEEILDDVAHKDRLKAANQVLSRADPVHTEHELTVKHSVDVREMESLVARLAQEMSVPVERLLGSNCAPLPPLIEGTVVREAEPDEDDEDGPAWDE
jgi:phage terminase small subunit